MKIYEKALRRHISAGLLLLALGAMTFTTAATEEENYFEAEIRPMLVESCYSCHAQNALGGLRVDSREALLKGGNRGPAIVPGSPDESLLIQAVRRNMDDLKMPLGGDPLTEAQIAKLEKWVKDGAAWPEEAEPAKVSAAPGGFTITEQQRSFWSFQPLHVSAAPDVDAPTEIDKFVAAKLAEKGLNPNPMADKRTLIRRATLDLTGLPPTPEEVEAFVKDESPDAWEKLIDRLLASPQYGERWGRFWLDVVRYGEDDTHGLAPGGSGHENYPNAYLYRDWVVKALNDDMPYDKFITAQLAADLMGKKELKDRPKGEWSEDVLWGRLQTPKWDGLKKEQLRPIVPDGHIVDDSLNKDLLPALGFLGQGPWYYDLGDAWQMRADERHDRVDVVTRGFLGLTVGCARCHNHKYDPLAQKDYYALAGVFLNSPYYEYPIVDQKTVDEWRKKDELVKQQNARISDFLKNESKLLSKAMAYQMRDYLVASWKVLGEPQMEIERAASEGKLDLEVLRRFIPWVQREPKNYEYLVPFQNVLHDEDVTEEEITKIAQEFQDTLLEIVAKKDEIDERNEKIRTKAWPLDDKPPIPMPNHFSTDFEKYFIAVESMDREPNNLYTDVFVRDLDTEEKPGGEKGGPGLLVFGRPSVEKPNWELEGKLGVRAQMFLESARADLKRLKKERGDEYPFVMGVEESPTITELPLHKRGSPLNLGEPVPRRFIQVLSDSDEPKLYTQGSGRMQLAEDISSHPITARVIVNRVWKWHFGTGIVNTPSNFGIVGDRPSHPELLDNLASRFVENGMSLKSLHREMMLSDTYKRTVAPSATAYAADPENRLYWRFAPRRLEAEAIRDSMLSVAGTIDLEVGGKSKEIDDPDFKRRAIYGKVSRFQISDYQKTFDFPNPNMSAEQRFSTSVPGQQLFFMNSEFVFDRAHELLNRIKGIEPEDEKAEKGESAKAEKAENEDSEKGAKSEDRAKVTETAEAEDKSDEKPEQKGKEMTDEEVIAEAYRILFQRAPTEAEAQAGLQFLADAKSAEAAKVEAEKAEAEKAKAEKAAVMDTEATGSAPAEVASDDAAEKTEKTASKKKKEEDKPEVTPMIEYLRVLLSSNEFTFMS